MDAEGRVSRRPLEQELVSRGVRMTHQRRLLVQIIQEAAGHLDARGPLAARQRPGPHHQ